LELTTENYCEEIEKRLQARLGNAPMHPFMKAWTEKQIRIEIEREVLDEVKRQEADEETTGPNLGGEESLNPTMSILKNARLRREGLYKAPLPEKGRPINEGAN
jgi:hypothetical protein